MPSIVYVQIHLGRTYFKARGVKKRLNLPIFPLRNTGKFNLNHIWDRVLLYTPGHKISPTQVYAHIHNNGHNQSILDNGHLQVNIGHSGHALNSDYVLRGS